MKLWQWLWFACLYGMMHEEIINAQFCIRNPLYRWTIGTPTAGMAPSSSSSNSASSAAAAAAAASSSSCAINDFAFSPCGKHLAVASQDGYLRIFYYNTMELTGQAKSYFGGLNCVAWSPDGKYIVSGGEDDLVNVYSVAERRIVLRGQGHKSWVSVVAFDPYNMSYGAVPDGLDFSGEQYTGLFLEVVYFNLVF
jgi:WD40 repeat protein